MHFGGSPFTWSCERGKFGTFIGGFPSDGVANMAVKGLIITLIYVRARVCVCVCVCESVLFCTRVCAGTPVQPLAFLHLLDPSCAHVLVTFSCFSPFFFSFFSFVPCWCVGGAYTCICRRFKTALFLAGHRALLLSVEMFSVYFLFFTLHVKNSHLNVRYWQFKKKSKHFICIAELFLFVQLQVS